MSSTVLTVNSQIRCYPQYPCFAACQQSLRVTPTGPTTANFGPTVSTKTIAGGGVCTCSDFNVINAQLVNSQQLVGSSSVGGAFSQVVLTGYPSSYTIQAQFTAGNGAGVCTLGYYVSSGPGILGVGYPAFGLWWAVLVGVIVFFMIVCTFMALCGCCSALSRRVSKGQTLSPPNTGAGGNGASAPSYAYTTSPGQQADIPIATAVPLAMGSDNPSGGGAIPVAVEAPYGGTTPHSNEARQVAVV